jgi:hypothetical protein
MNILARIFMTTHFDDLHKQGVTHTELSLQELQQLLIDGKITEAQFTKILMDNIGVETFMKCLHETMEACYGKDLLTKPIPEGLKVLCEEPKI